MMTLGLQKELLKEKSALEHLKESFQLVRHFRLQFHALSDEATLRLLETFLGTPFTNGEVRALFGVNRQATWAHLSELVQLGLIEKRGHTYRVSPFTNDFVSTVADTLRSLLTGDQPPVRDAASADLLRLAGQGIEALYVKGKIQQQEYFEYMKKLGELKTK
jgi:hypothetical protein